MKIKNVLLLASMMFCGLAARSQDVPPEKGVDIFGFVMMDAGWNFGQIHSDWYDVVRPTKLSSFHDEFAPDGNFFMSVRQTRLGVKGYTPTSMGTLKTHFEFELFGTGVDAGQTTLRLRHAYGELGKWGFGQTWSPFMDIDVFPNTVEYWGPCGMAFFRNIQARYMPIQGDTRLTIALERPGASADQGPYGQTITDLGNVKPNLMFPDLSAEYRMAKGWGYIEFAGIVRHIKWTDLDDIGPDLSGSRVGYGLSLSTNIKAGANDLIRGQLVWGAGIQNYMNDATVDLVIEKSDTTPIKADDAKTLGMTGLVIFLEHKWNEKFSSNVGYSMLMNDIPDNYDEHTFKTGQYGIFNVVYAPVQNLMTAAEVQWGARENLDKDVTGYDGTSIVKVQFSFKYNFSASIR
jgi:hypothetical protein